MKEADGSEFIVHLPFGWPNINAICTL